MASKRTRSQARNQEDRPEHVGSSSKGSKRRNHLTEVERHLKNDWDSMAEEMKTSCHTLYKHISAIELDNVVGWATNVTHHSADVSLEQTESNPLLDLPSSPLPASILYILNEEAIKIVSTKAGNSKYNHLVSAFDQSALVALGICLEEMITATLLPLAEAHTQRCKQQQEVTGNDWTDQWTLPPEDSILAMSKQPCPRNEKATLPTLSPPTLTAVPGEKSYSIMNLPLEGEVEVAAIRNWAKAHGLSEEFVQDNKDIFHVFQNNTLDYSE
ncbi:hypothetical protein ACA910_012709 [Epithemia clementina (nom. ined.)]